MKKNIYLSILVAGTLAFSSCNHEPDFPGVDELSQPTNVVKYAAVYSGAPFTADKPAKDALPAWLLSKYYTCDKASTAMVDYRFVQSIPEYVSAVSSASVYTLNAADYQKAWGAASQINYFSPSKPAATYLPSILAAAYATPTDGMLAVVNYNQAAKDGVQPAFSGNFESNTLDGWKSVAVAGTFNWQVKSFDNNYYIQQAAYNHKAGALNSYLVTATKIAVKDDMILSFDALYCNYKEEGGRISVLLTTDDLGDITKESLTAAQWTDITEHFTIATSPSNSGNLTPVKEFSLDAYAGKKVYLAFKYVGDGSDGSSATTTIRIDNVVIKDAAQVPVEYAEAISMYKYNEGAWTPNNEVVVLQPADYKAMGMDFFTATSALSYLPAYLGLKYPYAQASTIKAVAFKLSATEYMASELQKGTAGWTSTSEPIDLTDEYSYDGSNWIYVRTVPKAALNETFDGRVIVSNDKTMLEGWLNLAVQGELFWIDKSFNKNNYTQCSAFGAKSGVVETWLITPSLEIKSNYVLKFDMASGYWMHEGLQVYLSADFSGKEEEVATAKWTEITENFDFPKNVTGYSAFTAVGAYKLDSYVGQHVYIAFKYLGNKDNGETSTVQLDNIYVGE